MQHNHFTKYDKDNQFRIGVAYFGEAPQSPSKPQAPSSPGNLSFAPNHWATSPVPRFLIFCHWLMNPFSLQGSILTQTY